jgi:aspartate/methionine/tyrosine aminotransferase
MKFLCISSDANAAKLINQYARSGGHMNLVRTLADFYGPKLGRTIDPVTEVITTAGATEALYALVTAMTGPGDEVVLIEPFFDIYIGSVIMSGAKPVHVPLHYRPKPGSKERSSADFVLDEEEFRAAINERTRIVMLCTPQNPTGKVFSRKELEFIADCVRPFKQITVVSDEVYEWLTYDGVEHLRFATLPGMWDQTLTVSSAGKTFSVTGWKVGWVIGPAPRVQAIARAHQFIVFSISTPFQEAVANALVEAQKNNYFSTLRESYEKKRNFLYSALDEAGLNPVKPEGSFFIVADVGHIKLKDHQGRTSLTGLCPDVHDWRVCRWLTTDVGIAAIPISSFYSEEHSTTNLVRFAFCKTDDVLEAARDRLLKLQEKL